MSEVIFRGYSPNNKAVKIVLEDECVYVIFLKSGRKRFWNYFGDGYSLERLERSFIDAGYRLNW